MDETHIIAQIRRETLARLPAKLMRQGVNYAPDLFLYEVEGERVVLKDYSRKAWFVREVVGRCAIRQEARALVRLQGVEGVPQYRGRPMSCAVAMTFVDGLRITRKVRRAICGNERFVQELERIVTTMHQRGVVHLDMKHRTNLMTTADGRPVLIDFASALTFNPAWFGGRWGQALFAWVDRWSVRNWRRRFCPQSLSDRELRRAHLIRQLSFLWLPRAILDAFLVLIRRGGPKSTRQGKT